jgi:hypothetical protein
MSHPPSMPKKLSNPWLRTSKPLPLSKKKPFRAFTEPRSWAVTFLNKQWKFGRQMEQSNAEWCTNKLWLPIWQSHLHNKIYSHLNSRNSWILWFYLVIRIMKMGTFRPPLWSSGHSFWLQILMSRIRFPALPDFLRSSGSGTGFTQPREDNWGTTWMKK